MAKKSENTFAFPLEIGVKIVFLQHCNTLINPIIGNREGLYLEFWLNEIKSGTHFFQTF